MNEGDSMTGLTMTHTPIFTALVAADYDWPRKLLTAVDSAMALGVPRLELDLRDESREVPVFRCIGRDTWSGGAVNVQDGTRMDPTQRITIYALRIEGAEQTP